MRILVVCAANMCRSPAAAHALAAALPGVSVGSAGVDARAGTAACPVSAEVAGYDGRAHRAHLVTRGDVAAAQLVLAADREVRARLARLDPSARARTFTLRQAAALAGAVAATVGEGSVPPGAPPLPATAADRWGWLVAELDAARGTVPVPDEDVPDPHEDPAADHEAAVALAVMAAGDLARAARTVVGPGEPGEPDAQAPSLTRPRP